MALKKLNKNRVEKPNLPIKILQFGEGNFLRAFVDWMVDGANKKGVMNHGISAIQPIGGGDELEKIFNAQDCLYHVLLEGVKDKKPIREISLVSSMMEMFNPYREYERYRDIFLSEELEIIVSNTTEAGIRYEKGDSLAATPPASFPAKMTSLLHQRWKKFAGSKDRGLHIICCELIEDNGSTLRKYVLQHAEANGLEKEFCDWVRTACYFYDTLVDRIVTGFPKDNIDEIKAELGYDDNLVVKGEYFHVWAIGGDKKLREVFPLDKAGYNVLFMDCVKSFRDKKVRILNGSHTAMVPVALQLGCETVLDAFNIPAVEKYINRMVDEEVLPAIKEDPKELKEFAATIIERFYNPYLKHYLKDISLNSIAKWEARDWATVKDNALELNKSAKLCIFSFAALMVLYSGRSEVEFEPRDTPEFVEFIKSTFDAGDIKGWISGIVNNKKMWTDDLSSVPFFVDEVTKRAESILNNGMKKALNELLSE